MKKYICFLIVLIWFIIIFLFSNMNTTSSNGLSKKIINNFFNFTNSISITNYSDNKIESITNNLNLPIRKVCHTSIYFVLGILLIISLKTLGIPLKHVFIYTLIICFLYSLGDEYHQTFVSGRTGQFSDCLIDTTGALISILLYYFIYKIRIKVSSI